MTRPELAGWADAAKPQAQVSAQTKLAAAMNNVVINVDSPSGFNREISFVILPAGCLKESSGAEGIQSDHQRSANLICRTLLRNGSVRLERRRVPGNEL